LSPIGAEARQVATRVEHLADASTRSLLALHSSILEELRSRGILRTANNPTGDLAEHLFCKTFGWKQEGNSSKSFDAVDANGVRYQIKGRRLHSRNTSRQLSAIRDLDGFDVLAAILFGANFDVLRAVLIPASIVRAHSSYIAHTNSHKFLLRDAVCILPGVTEVTARLEATAQAS
jgi:hypothetical protein